MGVWGSPTEVQLKAQPKGPGKQREREREFVCVCVCVCEKKERRTKKSVTGRVLWSCRYTLIGDQWWHRACIE